MVIEIVFKSGAKSRVKVKSFTYNRIGCSWESFEGQEGEKIVALDYDSIAAVIRIK